MARTAGKGLGEMKDVPRGFTEGFEESASSDETKSMVRDLAKSAAKLKDTAADLAGDYKVPASPRLCYQIVAFS